MTPRGEALAFRIWQWANPRGWDCTTTEVADAIRSTPAAVGRIGYLKGWTSRFRRTEERAIDIRMGGGIDSLLAGDPCRPIIAGYARLADEPTE
jgi:hypothetical protein